MAFNLFNELVELYVECGNVANNENSLNNDNNELSSIQFVLYDVHPNFYLLSTLVIEQM